MDRRPYPADVTVTWRRNERVCWRRSGTVAVLAPPEGDDMLVLDGTGALAWELLAEPMSSAQLVDELAAAFDVGRDLVSDQLLPFLDELRAAGVVEPA